MQTVNDAFSCGLWHARALAAHAPESDLFVHFVFAHKKTRTRRAIKNPPGYGWVSAYLNLKVTFSRSIQYFYQRFPTNASGKFRIFLVLISRSNHFTTRRCCRDLLEPLGSFSKAGVLASDALFTSMCIWGLPLFLNHSLNLLTLNPSMSITFFMERGLRRSMSGSNCKKKIYFYCFRKYVR